MAQWTAFDHESAAILQQKTRTAVQLAGGDALSAVLAADTSAIALLPASSPAEIQLITVRRRKGSKTVQPASKKEKHEHVSYVASGFLGLNDEPVYENEEEPQPKKSWWKKLMG